MEMGSDKIYHSEYTTMNNSLLSLLPKWSVSIRDRSMFYEHLSNLIDGGVSIIEALKSFVTKTDNLRFKNEVDNLLFFVESGDNMSTAMRKIPGFFGDREIALVESGEESWTLQKAFMSIARNLREQDELRSKVIGALIYPIIILIFLVLAVTVVMIYVIPQIAPILTESWTEIPFSTKALMATSDFLSNQIGTLIAIIVACILIFQWYKNTPNGRLSIHRSILRIPAVWEVYRNYLLSQISTTLGLLMESGITIIKALRLSARSSNNVYVEQIFDHIIYDVAHGKRLGESMKEADKNLELFTHEYIQLIEVGEKTSTVNKACEKLANQYRRAIDYSLWIMVKFIEPIAILIAWVFVLWFALAIFSAIMWVAWGVGI